MHIRRDQGYRSASELRRIAADCIALFNAAKAFIKEPMDYSWRSRAGLEPVFWPEPM